MENWLRLLEKTRGKNFGKPIYDAIKIYASQTYYFDYYLMKTDEHGNEFFGILKPRLRHRLIALLFNPFCSKFYYMFYDDYFEAGIEFKNDFISSIYSRLYLPTDEIVGSGSNFCELMMIQEGLVNLYSNIEDQERDINHDFQFFILPTYSYFGDY